LDLVSNVRDQVRNLLKIRRERELPPPGSKPALGARIVCGDLRMRVQAGMSDPLWIWLLSKGWREVLVRHDRRRYRDIPHAYVTRLIDVIGNQERQRVLEAGIANASYRPVYGRDTLSSTEPSTLRPGE
jgi:hypothetical protein